MNTNEFIKTISEAITKAVIEALQNGIELEPGDRCPCCGAKKRKPNMSEKMLESNRRNIQKAIAARRGKK